MRKVKTNTVLIMAKRSLCTSITDGNASDTIRRLGGNCNGPRRREAEKQNKNFNRLCPMKLSPATINSSLHEVRAHYYPST